MEFPWFVSMFILVLTVKAFMTKKMNLKTFALLRSNKILHILEINIKKKKTDYRNFYNFLKVIA